MTSAEGEDGFFFGLATAPAHVEDRLDDAWMQFAEEGPCDHPESEQKEQPANELISSAAGDGGTQPPLTRQNTNKSEKIKKPFKVAMEAMIRGVQKYTPAEEEEPTPAEECHHNVAAWHNVPNP